MIIIALLMAIFYSAVSEEAGFPNRRSVKGRTKVFQISTFSVCWCRLFSLAGIARCHSCQQHKSRLAVKTLNMYAVIKYKVGCRTEGILFACGSDFYFQRP